MIAQRLSSYENKKRSGGWSVHLAIRKNSAIS
jgi:hypothetical protein